jgi:hypothetical protein
VDLVLLDLGGRRLGATVGEQSVGFVVGGQLIIAYKNVCFEPPLGVAGLRSAGRSWWSYKRDTARCLPIFLAVALDELTPSQAVMQQMADILGRSLCACDAADNDFPILNPTEYNRLGEIRFMEVKREIALGFIRQHPMQFVRLSIHRFFRFWGAPERWVWLALSPLAWVGMVLALWRKRWESAPYALVILIFPLVYYVTHVFGTFRHPIEPVELILASYAMVSAVSTVGPRLFRRRVSETS